MAPTPKPPGARRRANRDQTQWQSLPASGCHGKPPALPAKRPAWLKRTRDWWATIWSSPMATVWLPSDVDGLVRLAELKDQFARGDAPATALPAIQQLEDRYGLNPKARQTLQWLIADELDDQDAPSAPTGAPATGRRLKIVDPSAAA